jgi:hypothetical protein
MDKLGVPQTGMPFCDEVFCCYFEFDHFYWQRMSLTRPLSLPHSVKAKLLVHLFLRTDYVHSSSRIRITSRSKEYLCPHGQDYIERSIDHPKLMNVNILFIGTDKNQVLFIGTVAINEPDGKNERTTRYCSPPN